MFKRDPKEETSGFWISYADLMAGLLFVFILLIGAIVVKSVVLKSDLRVQTERLEALSRTLQEKERTLAHLAQRLETNRERLKRTSDTLRNKENKLARQHSTIETMQRRLTAQTKLIASLRRNMQELNTTLHRQEQTVTTLTRNVETLRQEKVALAKKLDQERKLRDTLEKRQTTLEAENKTLELVRNDLSQLQMRMDEKERRYQALLAKLQRQKAQIKALTGIRLNVIAALKSRLGDKLKVDKRSGALRLSSKILFDKGSARLKDEAKTALRRSFEEYVRALMDDPKIAPHLDKIVIQGHTDSDGDFLYNLALSQKRALAVMNYLLSLDVVKRYGLTSKLEASGRSYLDAIYDDNGLEDKEASRRIEINFRLKNDEAMQEIERILDAEE